MSFYNSTKTLSRTRQLFTYVVLIAFIALGACNSDNPEDPDNKEPDPEKETEPYVPGIGEARDITSFELVAEMGIGWNHGNSFDVTSEDKTDWGNPLPSKEIIDAVAQQGFGTLRIPVTWAYHQTSTTPYTIDSNYLKRIRNVVDYGFQNHMHVIINVHHDEEWMIPTTEMAESTKSRLSSLWTQVANYFIDYNDSLIFETLNEPREKGIAQEWSGGTVVGRQLVNDYNKVALDAIRATGKNNTKRHIMIPTWAASTVDIAMNDLVIPNDDARVIISLHTYFPWSFAGEGNGTWGSEQDKKDLLAEFRKIKQKWILTENRPVILGEWGTIEKNPLETRIAYSAYYVEQAEAKDLLTIVWDDGGMFRMFNRHSLTWDYPEVADAIIDASKR
ncbi:MAG: glycoside hydrolase family 5 protein [Bacteroidia bacterium]